MSAILALTRRSMIHSVRDIETLLMSVLLPVMLLLIFTYVFGGAITGSTGEYLDYVVPGIAIVCAGFGASYTAVSVARDMNEGLMDRFRTMDMPRSAAIAGHVVASVARNLVTTAVVIAVALALGFRPSATVSHWLLAAAVVMVYILGITALFAAIGIAARSVEAASGYGFMLLFLPYLSSAFAPVDSMPTWLQGFAAYQPITPVVDAIRSLLHGEPAMADAWASFAWGGAMVVVGFAAGTWLLAHRGSRR